MITAALKQIRWISLLLILILLIPIAAGCGTKDIDKRMFVIGVGIDKSDNEEKPYKVSLKVPVPMNKKSSGTSPGFIFLTEEAATISEALHLLTTHVDKNLEYGHAKFIVIGESILNEDLRVVMDIFLRRREFQQTAWTTVGKPSAESVLQAKPASDIPDINILFNRFSDIGTESSYIVSVFLFDFRRQLVERGIDPVLPVIETNEGKDKIIVNKAVVIDDNSKGKLELTTEQVEDYNMITNRMGSVRFELGVQAEDFDFTVYIDKVKTNYKITTNNNKPVVKMNLELTGVIEESTQRLVQHKTEEYNRLAAAVLKKRLEAFLTYLQKNEVDPIGFGLRYEATRLHTEHIEEEWNKLYPELSFDVTVHVKITSLGSIE